MNAPAIIKSALFVSNVLSQNLLYSWTREIPLLKKFDDFLVQQGLLNEPGELSARICRRIFFSNY